MAPLERGPGPIAIIGFVSETRSFSDDVLSHVEGHQGEQPGELDIMGQINSFSNKSKRNRFDQRQNATKHFDRFFISSDNNQELAEFVRQRDYHYHPLLHPSLY
jgi:extradiol dioxygenase family protein